LQVHKNNVTFEIQCDFGLNYHKKGALYIPKTTTIKRAFVPILGFALINVENKNIAREEEGCVWCVKSK
jgi:hypothetical protein